MLQNLSDFYKTFVDVSSPESQLLMVKISRIPLVKAGISIVLKMLFQKLREFSWKDQEIPRIPITIPVQARNEINPMFSEQTKMSLVSGK